MGLPQISARRTEELEAMLQELWVLRSELKGKNALTIYCAIAALLRECRRSDATVEENAVDVAPVEPLDAENSSVTRASFSSDDEWG